MKRDLSPEELAYIAEHRSELPGISAVTRPVRVYASEQVAVQAIGYVRPFYVADQLGLDFYREQKDAYLPNQMVGLDGVERSYEEALRGKNGCRLYLVGADQTALHQVQEVPPQPGYDVHVTIDQRVQLEIRDYIKEFLPKLRRTIPDAANAKGAYAVAMEVKTGKVVAMVSYPEYDPNVWVDGPDQATYEQIQYAVTNGTIREAPYDVRPKTGEAAVQENYKHPKSIVPAGSVVKPLTVMMGLSEQLIDPHDQCLIRAFTTTAKGRTKFATMAAARTGCSVRKRRSKNRPTRTWRGLASGLPNGRERQRPACCSATTTHSAWASRQELICLEKAAGRKTIW